MSSRFAILGGLLALAGCPAAPPTSSTTPPPPASVAAPAVRYLALGDSFTIGTGSSAAQAFPARLAARCAGRVELHNLAVNGYSTGDVIDRELPALSAFAPTYVTFAAGANDIVRGATPAEYRAHVASVLASLRASGARIVTLPQPDWSLSPAARDFGDAPAIHARIVEANAILRDETAAAGGTYLDLFPLMETQARAGMIAPDGLHPSAEAHDAWAAEIAQRDAGPCTR
ncbi:MAG TPA: SGNH/GDSL hydrolase family protein [Polyangiaceae bacterium]